MLPKFGLGVSLPTAAYGLLESKHADSRRVPYAGSWCSGIEQEPRRLPSRCRTGCFLTWIFGSRNRTFARHSPSMASFLVCPFCDNHQERKLIIATEMLNTTDLDLQTSIRFQSIVLVRPLILPILRLMAVMSKFHSPDNYWGNMRVDGDVAKKPTYVSLPVYSV